jgi:hypothetical protein
MRPLGSGEYIWNDNLVRDLIVEYKDVQWIEMVQDKKQR